MSSTAPIYERWWFGVGISLLVGALIMAIGWNVQPPPPPPPTGPVTGDGVRIVVGERYYRSGYMVVARNPGDDRPGDHIVAFWSGMLVTSTELRDGVWWVRDERFVGSTGTLIEEPASEVWASKDAMRRHLGTVIPTDDPAFGSTRSNHH